MMRIMAALAAATSLVGGASEAMALTRTEAMQLYAAGGFPISADGDHPTNRCGTKASPRITFVDMNGDKRKEALFIDQSPCYKQDGRWYAIATQQPDGRWRRVLEGEGSIAAAGTSHAGWFVLNATSRGKVSRLHFDGTAYRPANSQSAAAAPAAPSSSSTGPAAKDRPVAVGNMDRDKAIFLAAGFKRVGGHWESGCNDGNAGGVSYEPGSISEIRDLNGDGRPDAVVIEGSAMCYGMAGQAFWLLSQQADGAWKLLYQQIGIPDFQKSKGVGGWPDIVIGGPGFCFPVVRWNGKTYALNRREYEGKPCSR